MSAPLRTYSPDQISVVIGDRPITGFAEGETINVERLNDTFTDVSGMSGEVARTRSNDKRGEVTLTLMQTSPDNEYLSGLAAEDEATGTSTFNILIRDQGGESLHEAESAWILKPATAAYGKEQTDREWVIRCANLGTTLGGNKSSEA